MADHDKEIKKKNMKYLKILNIFVCLFGFLLSMILPLVFKYEITFKYFIFSFSIFLISYLFLSLSTYFSYKKNGN